MKRQFNELIYKQVFWQREIEFSTVLELVIRLATQERKPIIWEIRSPKDSETVRYFLGAEKGEFNRLEKIFRGYGRILFTPTSRSYEQKNAYITSKTTFYHSPYLKFKNF